MSIEAKHPNINKGLRGLIIAGLIVGAVSETDHVDIQTAYNIHYLGKLGTHGCLSDTDYDTARGAKLDSAAEETHSYVEELTVTPADTALPPLHLGSFSENPSPLADLPFLDHVSASILIKASCVVPTGT